MTHRMKYSTLSPEISGSSVTDTPKRKYRRKIPPPRTTSQENIYDDTDPSRSESPHHHDEYDDEDEDEEHTTFTESETPRNRFFSPETESELIQESGTVDEAAASLNSASNFPNLLQPTASIAAYVNIAPLPIFRGGPDECPVTHLSRFAKVCRANNASSVEMMMKIFPVTLDDEAALWYDLNIEPYPSLNWEEIKSSFMHFYRRTEFVDQFRSELMMIRQGDGESVHAYFLRMQWILKRWPEHGIPDGLLKGIFVDGLKEDFQDWIVPQKPNSLDEALGLALTWEQAQSIRTARNRKNMTGSPASLLKCGFCEGAHEEQRCEIRERIRELWMKSREKKVKEVSSPAVSTRDGAPVKKLVKSMSMVTGSGDGKQGEEEEKEEGGLGGWKKKSQCQCWKHQCWKKNLERNNSIVTRNSTAE